jgi:glycosyltransferase involved in cell wall biosynthesis
MPPFGPTKSAPKDTWTVGYIGRVRDLKAFQLLVLAVKTLQPHHRPKIRVAGDGTMAAKVRMMLMEEVEAGHLEAEVSGAFDHAELPELLADVDVMFAMYAPLRGNILQGALPVKMFDAAAQGIPSVVNDGCLMGDLAESEGLGIAATWGDEENIGQALLDLKDRVVELSASGERERQRWLKAMTDVFAMLQ